MAIKMFNNYSNNYLSRVIINNDPTYDNLYDYIEKLFFMNNDKINNIRVSVEDTNILTILLDVNSTHNKELFIKTYDNVSYKVIIVSHYYENGFSLNKTYSERILSLDNVVLPELLTILDDYFANPEL